MSQPTIPTQDRPSEGLKFVLCNGAGCKCPVVEIAGETVTMAFDNGAVGEMTVGQLKILKDKLNEILP